jgi:hypothetical protein
MNDHVKQDANSLSNKYDYDTAGLYYLLNAVGLTPGGSSTVYIYTQTIHRTTQRDRIRITEHA